MRTNIAMLRVDKKHRHLYYYIFFSIFFYKKTTKKYFFWSFIFSALIISAILYYYFYYICWKKNVSKTKQKKKKNISINDNITITVLELLKKGVTWIWWRHCFLFGIVTSSYQQCVDWRIIRYVLKYMNAVMILLNCCYQSLFPSLSLSSLCITHMLTPLNTIMNPQEISLSCWIYKCCILWMFLNKSFPPCHLFDTTHTYSWQTFDKCAELLFCNVFYHHTIVLQKCYSFRCVSPHTPPGRPRGDLHWC